MPSDKIIKLEELQLNDVYNTVILEKMYCSSDISRNKAYTNILDGLEIVNKTVSEIIKTYNLVNKNDDIDEIGFSNYINDSKEVIINIGENTNLELF
jgi:hypothetical protein